MFRRILVGYTGSDLSRKALTIALELAAHDASEVTAVAVVSLPEGARLMGEIDDAMAKADESLTAAFDWARFAAARFEVPLTVYARAGHPAETLVRVAEEEGCDLIVLGHRHRVRLREWWSDSIVERVLHIARCSTMLVP